MLYYKDGDISSTSNAELSRRAHLLSMLSAHNYPGHEEMVGALHNALGYAPVDISRHDARRRVRRVLDEFGYQTLTIEDVLEVVDDSWKLAIKVGN